MALATCQGLNGHMHLAAIVLDWMMKINKPVTMESSLGRCSYRALIYTQYLRHHAEFSGTVLLQGTDLYPVSAARFGTQRGFIQARP